MIEFEKITFDWSLLWQIIKSMWGVWLLVIGIIVFRFSFDYFSKWLKEKRWKTISKDSEFSRRIPAKIKRVVFDRDEGKCVNCGATQNLHFDHIIPYAKGGSSTDPKNIQILCGKHNLQKSDKIK